MWIVQEIFPLWGIHQRDRFLKLLRNRYFMFCHETSSLNLFRAQNELEKKYSNFASK